MSNPRQEALLYVFEDNEAVIKMIIGKKPYNETRIQNPQSCSCLVVRQNQSGPQDSVKKKTKNQLADTDKGKLHT